MRINLGIIMGFVFLLNMSLPAMVIHNYCSNKGDVTKNEPGKFNEDYLFLGYKLDFTGATRLGLIALCEKLDFSGTVGNGLIGAGADLRIKGNITGNNYLACKTLLINDSARVNGNVFAACAKMIVDGKIEGDLDAATGELVINNEIKGNVSAYSGRIVIGEKGRIDGNLYYSSKEKLTENELKRVSGTVTVDKKRTSGEKSKSAGKGKNGSIGFFVGFAFFISYVIISSLLLFLPVFKKLEHQQSDREFWTTSLYGLIPVFIYPALIVVSFVMVVTIPFGLILILGMIPLFYIANIIGTVLIGKFLIRKLKWNVKRRHLIFLTGAIAGAIISLIPGINFLYLIFTAALGWGMYVSFLFDKKIVMSE